MRVGNLENICLGNAAYRLVTARIVSHFQVGGLKKIVKDMPALLVQQLESVSRKIFSK